MSACTTSVQLKLGYPLHVPELSSSLSNCVLFRAYLCCAVDLHFYIAAQRLLADSLGALLVHLLSCAALVQHLTSASKLLLLFLKRDIFLTLVNGTVLILLVNV